MLIGGFDAAVIVATHDPEFAAAFAERVVLLADGRVIADGTDGVGALPAGPTSRPRPRESSAAPAARCYRRTASRCCAGAECEVPV